MHSEEPQESQKIFSLQEQRVAPTSKQSTRREAHAMGKASSHHMQSESGEVVSVSKTFLGNSNCTLVENNYFPLCLSIY